MGLIRNISEWGELDEQSTKTMQNHGSSASGKPSEKGNERPSPEAVSFGREGKTSWLMESVLCHSFSERSLYQSMVQKILLFFSKSLKQQTLKGRKRSNSVLVAVRFEISLLYHQNQTEALPYAGTNTDSQDEDKHRCSWFAVGGFGGGGDFFFN